MARRKSLEPQTVVVVKHAPAPDAQARLRHAYDQILRAAARAENEPTPSEDTDNQEVDHDH